jgi:hypothetical protein
MIEDASHEHLKHFMDIMFDRLKKADHEMYEELEEELYEDIYGCHFNKWLLEKATAHMRNEDGSHGPKWDLEQTNEVAKQYNITFDHFNEYDWNYVMNMIYSDFFGAIPNEVGNYVKMAKKFLDDKDAPKGKAYHYYMTMHKER